MEMEIGEAEKESKKYGGGIEELKKERRYLNSMMGRDIILQKWR